MKILWCLSVTLLLSAGCARVRVEAPKEPIKVDVSMRMDIYQHVVKDIDDIENMVSAPPAADKKEAGAAEKNSLLGLFVSTAYCQEQFSPAVEAAALRRRERYQRLRSWESQGVVGENRSGLLEIRKPAEADADIQEAVRQENSDRMLIYSSIAQANNLALEEVQRLYAQRLQSDAPAGTPVQVRDQAGSGYLWQIKQ